MRTATGTVPASVLTDDGGTTLPVVDPANAHDGTVDSNRGRVITRT